MSAGRKSVKLQICQTPNLQTIVALDDRLECNTSAARLQRNERVGAHPAMKSRWRYCTGNRLVQRSLLVCLKPLDLVLTINLRRFNSTICKIVCGKVHERVVQFVFEYLVFTFKFNKMRL